MRTALPRRFSWASVAAMVITASVATFLNARLVVTGFYNWRGLPFRWDTWSDFGPKHTYYLWALIADIGIALAAVVAVGILVELKVSRLSHDHSTDAA
jgi:hypothetical protein